MFARAVATATAAAMRARGLHAATESIGPWSLRVWRGGPPDGEPWTLLHGMGATSATYLPTLPGLLRDGCRVVLPELSANGGTIGPRAAIGVAEGVEVVRELLRREFPGRAPTLAGVSLGGWIAAKVAIAEPRRLARLVLVVPGGWRDQDWERIERMVRVQTLADIEAMWRALFVRPPWFLRLGRVGLFLLYRTPTVQDVLATVREEDAYGPEELARVEAPTALIWGAGDSLFRPEVGEAMRRALPRAGLTVIEGAGHAVQWERPRAFAAAVERFRRETPLPGRAPRHQNGAPRAT